MSDKEKHEDQINQLFADIMILVEGTNLGEIERIKQKYNYIAKMDDSNLFGIRSN